MKINELDELETQLNQIAYGLDKVESLSSILLDCVRNDYNLKAKDIDNLASVLKEKITDLKNKFDTMEAKLIF